MYASALLFVVASVWLWYRDLEFQKEDYLSDYEPTPIPPEWAAKMGHRWDDKELRLAPLKWFLAPKKESADKLRVRLVTRNEIIEMLLHGAAMDESLHAEVTALVFGEE